MYVYDMPEDKFQWHTGYFSKIYRGQAGAMGVSSHSNTVHVPPDEQPGYSGTVQSDRATRLLAVARGTWRVARACVERDRDPEARVDGGGIRASPTPAAAPRSDATGARGEERARRPGVH